MEWSFNGTTAIFIQIADKIRTDILNGVYPPGSQLPTVRALATEASVNPNTMQRSLAYLEEEGIVSSKATRGIFVTEDTELIDMIRKKKKAAAVHSMLEEMRRMGISRQELLEYIDKEEY